MSTHVLVSTIYEPPVRGVRAFWRLVQRPLLVERTPIPSRTNLGGQGAMTAKAATLSMAAHEDCRESTADTHIADAILVKGCRASESKTLRSCNQELRTKDYFLGGCFFASSSLSSAKGEYVAALPLAAAPPLPPFASSCRWCSLSWQYKHSSSQLLPSNGLLS